MPNYIATQKFVRTSPRKLRLVADMAKKLGPVRAVEILPYSGKRANEPLQKVIKTAIANAVALGASQKELVFKEIQIGEGPRLKRGNPISRGQWHSIKKRMSHIRVVLTTISETKENPKVEKIVEKKEIQNIEKIKPVKKAVMTKTKSQSNKKKTKNEK